MEGELNMNKEILEIQFDTFIDIARKRIQKRKEFKMVYISSLNFSHSSKNKAMFVVRKGVQYIELYKPALINHYIMYYPEDIPFHIYLTSIVIHEFVHRWQYIKEFNKNFKWFKTMYECYPDRYEEPARKIEKHFINFILHRNY
jgi:hypothetical protein